MLTFHCRERGSHTWFFKVPWRRCIFFPFIRRTTYFGLTHIPSARAPTCSAKTIPWPIFSKNHVCQVDTHTYFNRWHGLMWNQENSHDHTWRNGNGCVSRLTSLTPQWNHKIPSIPDLSIGKTLTCNYEIAYVIALAPECDRSKKLSDLFILLVEFLIDRSHSNFQVMGPDEISDENPQRYVDWFGLFLQFWIPIETYEFRP